MFTRLYRLYPLLNFLKNFTELLRGRLFLKSLFLMTYIFINTYCFAESDVTSVSQKPMKEVVKNNEGEQFYAIIHPTKGHAVEGLVTFTKVPAGVRIVADIYNLKAGKHGFHLHEHGDCSAHDGSSAGGHYNPTAKKHGGPDSKERHVGDMGNLVANINGYAHYDRVDDLMHFSGVDTIKGRSVVIHADEDDLKTQPTGNSGPRIGCGLIED